jgi:hypothetical protein
MNVERGLLGNNKMEEFDEQNRISVDNMGVNTLKRFYINV